MLKIAIGAARGFQIIFSAVVLGLSVTLAKGQIEGSVPATTGYGSFIGAIGIIGGFIGIAGLFVELLAGIVGWAIDALIALLLLAGGLAWVIQLRNVNCNSWQTIISNPILSCGAQDQGDHFHYSSYCLTLNDVTNVDVNNLPDTIINKLNQRCTEARTDYIFMFVAFVTTVAALGLSFMYARRAKSYSY